MTLGVMLHKPERLICQHQVSVGSAESNAIKLAHFIDTPDEAVAHRLPRNSEDMICRDAVCIELFDGITSPQRKLPVKRIFVGPHANGVNRRRSVEILLTQHGVDASVTISDIPYLG